MNLPFNEGKHPSSEIISSNPLGKVIHDRRDVEMIEVLLRSMCLADNNRIGF